MSGNPAPALSNHAFVHGMFPDYVERLADAAVEISVPTGHRFFEEGGRADRFWLVTAGRVALDLHTAQRASLIVETLGSGDVVGLSWLSPPYDWQFGAVAVEPTTAFEFDAAAVIALCDSRPRIRVPDRPADGGRGFAAAACHPDPDARPVRHAQPETRGAVSLQPVPVRYRVTSSQAETHDTVTLGLEPVDQPIAAHQPGQFTMLYAFGIGEVPISISGTSAGPGLVQTIRSVGAVTRALCAAAPGQLVGVRGPYGTDWGVADAAGQDVIIVAGGIGLAPLRPALLAALAARDRYRGITLLIGARSPMRWCSPGNSTPGGPPGPMSRSRSTGPREAGPATWVSSPSSSTGRRSIRRRP